MTASPAATENVQSSKDPTSTAARQPPNILEETEKIKNWELFPGRNKILCDGRIIMAKQTGVLYFTVGLILITVALFFVFDCRLTLVKLNYGFLIPIVASWLFLFCLACLFRTAWSDPGIIPRATAEEADYLEKYLQSQYKRKNGSGSYRPPPRTIDIVINGSTIKLKYCFTCKIFRPPRASHCSMCDNCVENFDHHCPWVGNCVGRRNYRFFYLFVTSLTLLCIFIFSFAIVNLVLLSSKPDVDGFLMALKYSPGTPVELLICFFSVWSVLGLSGYHSYLICYGITTNEDIKGIFSRSRSDIKNPFLHSNFISNFAHTLCSPLPPSFLKLREYATPEYIKIRKDSQNRYVGEQQLHQTEGATKTSPFIDTENYDTSKATYPRQVSSPVYDEKTKRPPTKTEVNDVPNESKGYTIVVDPSVTDNPTCKEGSQADHVVEFHRISGYEPCGDLDDQTHDDVIDSSALTTDSSALLLQSSNRYSNGLEQVGIKPDKLKCHKISAV